jgi:magnesium-transporting ATPase (P-type)
MICIVRDQNKVFTFVKGASEVLLEQAEYFISSHSDISPLSPSEKANIKSNVIDSMASNLIRHNHHQLSLISQNDWHRLQRTRQRSG